jgi:hypothetical protein
VVSFDGLALPTPLISASQLRASGSAPAAKPLVPIAVTTPDGEVSAPFLRGRGRAGAARANHDFSDGDHRPRLAHPAIQRHGPEQLEPVGNLERVNGIAGGNSVVGTIAPSGAYRAPVSVPNPATVTVSATAVAIRLRRRRPL